MQIVAGAEVGRTINLKSFKQFAKSTTASVLICSICQVGGLISCGYSNAPVNSNVNTGVENRVSPQANLQRQAELKRRVAALANEPLGPSSLGFARAMPTENTEYIVEQKGEAVPLLVEALKEQRKPVLIGYAASCLRLIGSAQGKEVASRTLYVIRNKGERMSIEDRFAVEELTRYLEHLSVKGKERE